MIYIGICDDDKNICGQLETFLTSNKFIFEDTIEIEVFLFVEECLEFIQEHHSFDFLFLDIEFIEMSGLHLGTYIRDKLQNYYMQIIYISAKDIYALQLFDTQPLNFLQKPLNRKKLIEVIKTGVLVLKNKKKEFIFKDGHYVQKEYIDNILYFEGYNRQVIMHLQKNKKIFYGTLKDVFNQVEKYGFFYCHKSYIVNYEKIKIFKYDSLIMANKAELSIAQSKRKRIKELQLLQETEKI